MHYASGGPGRGKEASIVLSQEFSKNSRPLIFSGAVVLFSIFFRERGDVFMVFMVWDHGSRPWILVLRFKSFYEHFPLFIGLLILFKITYKLTIYEYIPLNFNQRWSRSILERRNGTRHFLDFCVKWRFMDFESNGI